MNTQNKPISKVGIVLRPSSPELKSIFLQTREMLEDSGIEVMLDSISGGMIELLGRDFHQIAQRCDGFISLGGDGTLISMLRRAFSYNLPCMGINTGRLGFLTAFMPNQLREFIPHLQNGSYALESHLVLQALVFEPCMGINTGRLGFLTAFMPNQLREFIPHLQNGSYALESHLVLQALVFEDKDSTTPLHSILAINEFLINKHELSGMVQIDAHIDEMYFNSYRCDGLIIGTPTGSTAYNISAGGSVIYPYCRNILLTPIAPHSLTQRPLVLSDEFVLEFYVKQRAKLIIDGQEMLDILPHYKVQIRALPQSAMLIYPPNRDYFSVLKEKFSWGEEH